MLYIALKGFETSNAIGVMPIHSVEELAKFIDKHHEESKDRFCPFFVNLRAGLRLSRWVARDLGGHGFQVRLEQDQTPVFVAAERLMETSFLGRYIREGRLFYDSLNLELPANLKSMQRFS